MNERMTTNTKDQQAELEQTAREALMATREGKLDWEESFRPGAFRATIPLRYSPDTTQIEMLGRRDTGRSGWCCGTTGTR